MRFGGRGPLGTSSFHHWKTERSACLGIPPPALPHSWLAENKVGDIQMAVGAFEPGAGGRGRAADKECFFKQKRKCWLRRRGKEAASCCWWWLFCERGGAFSVPLGLKKLAGAASPASAPSLLPEVAASLFPRSPSQVDMRFLNHPSVPALTWMCHRR